MTRRTNLFNAHPAMRRAAARILRRLRRDGWISGFDMSTWTGRRAYAAHAAHLEQMRRAA